MRLVQIFTGGFLTAVAANMDTLDKLYNTMIDARANATGRPIIGAGPSMRFTPGVRFAFSQLQEYGCWCFLGDQHGNGKGQPQDAFDNICQKLHHGTTCANMIPGCNTLGMQYQIIASSDSNGDFLLDCETLNNGDACAEATCYLESKFMEGFINEAIQGGSPNLAEYSASNGFDHQRCFTQVPAANPTEYTEICCGEYKHNTRKPIKVFEGEQRECCESGFKGRFTVFNPTVNECCSGNVESVGSC